MLQLTRACALTIIISLAPVGGADAAARVKKTRAPAPASAVVVLRDRPAAPPAPARFFSINRVLANPESSTPVRRQLASASALSATDAAPLAAAPEVSDEPFGLFPFRAPDGLLWSKWRGIEAQLAKEQAGLADCRDDEMQCSLAAARFSRLIADARALSGRTRLTEVNARVNAAIRYVSDYAQHGVPDRWSTPLATFGSGRGDCEDYAIAKYVALREAGTPASELRIVLVHDATLQMDHAVLAARHDGRWLILDNLRSSLLDDGELQRYLPLFALDHEGVKLFAAPYAALAQHESERDVAPAGETAGGSAAVLPLVM
jgi:predicted transglutaminase-like cysteine proteinase